MAKWEITCWSYVCKVISVHLWNWCIRVWMRLKLANPMGLLWQQNLQPAVIKCPTMVQALRVTEVLADIANGTSFLLVPSLMFLFVGENIKQQGGPAPSLEWVKQHRSLSWLMRNTQHTVFLGQPVLGEEPSWPNSVTEAAVAATRNQHALPNVPYTYQAREVRQGRAWAAHTQHCRGKVGMKAWAAKNPPHCAGLAPGLRLCSEW